MRVDGGEDLYGVLGVRPGAGTGEIREARAALLRRWHPDRNPAPEAVERSRAINRAVDLLLDPAYRAEYDRLRAGRGPGPAPAPRLHLRELRRLTRYRGRPVDALAVDGPRGLVALGARGDAVHVLDAGGAVVRALGCEGSRRALAFGPGGELLAAAGTGSTRIWRTHDWALVDELPHAGGREGSAGVAALAFHPHGDCLLVGHQEARLTLRELGSGAILGSWPGIGVGRAAQACAFSADGRWLAAAVRPDGPTGGPGAAGAPGGPGAAEAPGVDAAWELAVFELPSGRRVAGHLPAAPTAAPPLVAFTPGQERLRCCYDSHLALTDAREACVLELETGGWGVRVERRRRYGVDTVCSSYAQSPDGRWWATAGRDGTVVIWDADHAQPAGRVRLRRSPAPLLAWTADPSVLLVADGWGDLARWRIDA